LIPEPEERGPQPDMPSREFISDQSLLRRIQSGHSDASTQLYLRYAQRLQALVASKSSPDLARRVDAEDIVQSVFRTFFRRAALGDYSVPEGEQLWKLLLVIALNKVRAEGAYHRAAKRDVRQTRGGEAFEQAIESGRGNDEIALATLRMVIEDLLAGMPEANRRVIELRIEGNEVKEITELTQRSKRTVERVLQSFRARLEALVHEDSSG
jgi:RNA polymerase sigma factor (sigma-70 family)